MSGCTILQPRYCPRTNADGSAVGTVTKMSRLREDRTNGASGVGSRTSSCDAGASADNPMTRPRGGMVSRRSRSPSRTSTSRGSGSRARHSWGGRTTCSGTASAAGGRRRADSAARPPTPGRDRARRAPGEPRTSERRGRRRRDRAPLRRPRSAAATSAIRPEFRFSSRSTISWAVLPSPAARGAAPPRVRRARRRAPRCRLHRTSRADGSRTAASPSCVATVDGRPADSLTIRAARPIQVDRIAPVLHDRCVESRELVLHRVPVRRQDDLPQLLEERSEPPDDLHGRAAVLPDLGAAPAPPRPPSVSSGRSLPAQPPR